jgi:hypothetical protein
MQPDATVPIDLVEELTDQPPSDALGELTTSIGGSRSRGVWAAIAATDVEIHARDDRRTIIALCCILL